MNTSESISFPRKSLTGKALSRCEISLGSKIKAILRYSTYLNRWFDRCWPDSTPVAKSLATLFIPLIVWEELLIATNESRDH